jgi:hypothetical protein
MLSAVLQGFLAPPTKVSTEKLKLFFKNSINSKLQPPVKSIKGFPRNCLSLAF